MIISDLKARISERIHDVGMVEITTTQYLNFINDAVYDARNVGWLIPVADNTTLVEAVNDWTFIVPAGITYIYSILRENVATLTYDFEFPKDYWRLDLIGTDPTISFDERTYLPDAGAHLMIKGQARPPTYAADGDTVQNMMESFLRERATYYAAAFVAGGLSQYAQYRQKLADTAFAISSQMVANSPQEFRMMPSSVKVPTR